MSIVAVVPKERATSERRVAITPDIAKRLQDLDVEVWIEQEAGIGSTIEDKAYTCARLFCAEEKLPESTQIIFKVQPPTADEICRYPKNAILISYLNPYNNPDLIEVLRAKGITSFAVEMIPRITRAQSMDVLSSQAAASGYQAMLMGAQLAGRFLPMLTTAAGTIRPAKVLIIGAGVAGLQAIATAKRLGAVVEAYDIRPSSKQEIESLGARFVDTGIKADGERGYARDLTEEEKQAQADRLAKHVAAADVIISTASVPGKKAPQIITKEMVEQMHSGAVIIDLAAENGGNCELTQAEEQVYHKGVLVYGPLHVASMMAVHSSQMYARNLFNFAQLLIDDGNLSIDWEDQILQDSVVTHQGEIKQDKLVNPK